MLPGNRQQENWGERALGKVNGEERNGGGEKSEP